MTETGFSAALDRERWPRRIGDARLRHSAELLIAECVPALDATALIPDVLLLTGAAAGVVTAATLIAPTLRAGSVWGTLSAAAICAVTTIVGLRMRGRRHGRRGFVVNFDQHLVRVDEPGGLRVGSTSTLVPFGDVEAVEIVERGPNRAALALVAKGRTLLLLDGVEDRERPTLERFRRVLEAAFAADVTPPAGA